MLRKMLGMLLVVALLGSVAQGYWVRDAITGGRTAWYSSTGPTGHTNVLTQTGPGQYVTMVTEYPHMGPQVGFAGYWVDTIGTGDAKANNGWWALEGIHEWDRYPEPWGLKAHEFAYVGQSLDFGRETVRLTPDFNSGWITWQFEIPGQDFDTVTLHGFGAYLNIMASDDGVNFTGLGQHFHNFSSFDRNIPLSEIDMSVPGQATFYVKYQGVAGPGAAAYRQSIEVTPEPATMLLLVGGMAGILAKRKR